MPRLRWIELDCDGNSPILRRMKRCLQIAALALVAISLNSCGMVGRTLGSAGRTIGINS